MSRDFKEGLIIIGMLVALIIGLLLCSRNVSEYEDYEDPPSWGRGL
jgi:hypothetical protein